jgi:hypothetical protein
MTTHGFRTFEEIEAHIKALPKAHHLGEGLQLTFPALPTQGGAPMKEGAALQAVIKLLYTRGYQSKGGESTRTKVTWNFIPLDQGHLEVGYYSELQKRLIGLFQTVACDQRNFGTFSVVMASIFLDSASYLDSLAQNLIRAYASAGKTFKSAGSVRDYAKKLQGDLHFNMADYRCLLDVEFGLSAKEVNLNCHGGDYYGSPTACLAESAARFPMSPFAEWSSGQSPAWWKAFTDVKHDRIKHGNKATLENTLLSMAAVVVVLVEYRPRYMRESAAGLDAFRLFTPLYWKISASRMAGLPVFTDV